MHVAGAVRRPGVYRLRPGARVEDAVTRAGGARARADLGARQPRRRARGRPPDPRPAAGAAPRRRRRRAPRAGRGRRAAPGVPLNLNTATLEQLDTLDGIGPATAQQILEYREEHGGFGSVEELDQVPGIGEKRLATLREKVRV